MLANSCVSTFCSSIATCWWLVIRCAITAVSIVKTVMHNVEQLVWNKRLFRCRIYGNADLDSCGNVLVYISPPFFIIRLMHLVSVFCRPPQKKKDMFFPLIYRCFLFYHNNLWSTAPKTSHFTDIFLTISLWWLSHFSFCSITSLTLYNVFTDQGFNPI